MLNLLPSEIIYNIFSFLSYDEVYSIRTTCRQFRIMGEHHIYNQIKTLNQSVVLKLDESKDISMKLIASHYDAENRIIEFVPETNATLSLTNSKKWFAYHRLLKIHFSAWNTSSTQLPLECLDPQDRALFLYHHTYNSLIEKVYELPSWNTTNKSRRYIGDKGLILSMGYKHPSNSTLIKQESKPIKSLPTSYYGYPMSPAALSPIPAAPSLEVKWVRVTLDWVISGLKPSIPTTQIYKNDFIRLDQMLAKQGYFKYDPLSEPVLDYIVQQDHELPRNLLDYIHSHTHECRTRLSRLQHMLEGAGIDAQVIWKYTFAKSFVVGSGCLLGEEDVIRRIQDSEQEWRQKKPNFVRKLNLLDSH